MYSFANLFKPPEALFERPKVLFIKFGTELFRNNVIQKIRYIEWPFCEILHTKLCM